VNRRALRFAGTFLVLLVAGTVLARTPWALTELRDPLREGLARTVSATLVPFGVETRVVGTRVHGGTGAVEIVYDCDGVGLAIFFVAATLAFPIGRRRDVLPGLVGGLLVIALANVFRLAALTWLSLHDREIFEFVHAYLFQGFLVVTTVVTFAVWAVWAQRARP
jgi:exosortase H (IPTLxxWG-CTERM-specific)